MDKTPIYLKDLFDHIDLSNEAAEFFISAYRQINSDTVFKSVMDRAIANYLTEYSYEKSEAILSEIASRSEYKTESLFMLMLMIASEQLRQEYADHNISEDIFWNTVTDFRCKTNECIACKGYPGTFVGHWFAEFFKLNRFSVGRFQFEIDTFKSDKPFVYEGRTIHPGEHVVNLHVPSTGISLTDDIRIASYRDGYDFMMQRYGELFPDGIIPYTCCSWLLHPINKEILPRNLNILKYADDFSIVWVKHHDTFINGWRIYGADADLPPDQLPRNTSLQSAYTKHLQKGGKTGEAYGVFLFDGKNIVNR